MPMLTNITKMLVDAGNEHYAIAQININNLEWISVALDTAQETKSPLILGVSMGAAKYMSGYKNIADMVKNMMAYKKTTVPIALHLDHGNDEAAKQALEGGFSSVMFDGSSLEFSQNLEKTNQILALAKKYSASVEGEIGGVGGQEDGQTFCGQLADVSQCQQMAKQSISALAVGIGNIHGVYPSNWRGLDFSRLAAIKDATKGMPLVLHGGTGIPCEQIKKAISLGICKININTECQLAFAQATRKYIEQKCDLDQNAKGFDPRKLLKPGCLAIRNVIIEKLTMFGCLGKAK